MVRLLPLLALLAGCAGDPATAIRLRLSANPELNSEAQVLAALDRIELVFDSPAGFDNVPAAGGKVGPLVARDVDSDGVQELVLEEPAAGESFPLLRLLPGSNLGHDFSIRAVGWAATREAAVGGATAVSFAEGESHDVSVPLDLCDGYLPPRVLYTVPGSGEALGEKEAAELTGIRVYFSKLVDPATLQGNVRVVDTATGQSPKGSWKLQKLSAPCLGAAEERSLALLELEEPCGLETGSYRVEASGVRDPAGTPLDQTALQQGADPFASSFTVSRTTPPGGCIGSGGLCASDQDCEALKRCDLDPTSPTYKSCVWRDGLPGGTACGTCPAGYVCAITSTGPTCVRDCRSAGACVGGETCDPKTGLCR